MTPGRDEEERAENAYLKAMQEHLLEKARAGENESHPEPEV